MSFVLFRVYQTYNEQEIILSRCIVLKYIGPFLRLNNLDKTNIKNQLFHLAKESIKHVCFYSKCGILLTPQELKVKDYGVNSLKHPYPILSIYRKASPKLKNINNNYYWCGEKLKKDIIISSNAFMTLSLLELSDYYFNFKNIDEEKYNFSNMYRALAKKQLEFYATYMRNEEGVFVDKKDISETPLKDIKLEIKNPNFSFSDQALLMCSFYKYYLSEAKADNDVFKNFSLDILNMLIQFKDELYSTSLEDLVKTTLALNIFYSYSKEEHAKLLLIDLFELLYEKYFSHFNISSNIKLEYLCIYYINSYLLYKNTLFLRYKDIQDKLFIEILNFYNSDLGMFVKSNDKKPFNYTPLDICLYINCLLINSFENKKEDTKNIAMLTNIYKNQLIESGIILSWPEAPNLDDRERYLDFSLKSEDLLDEKNFKSSSIISPDISELAPVFIRSIKYKEKKKTFKQGKDSFYSDRNMPVFFMNIYLYNNYL
ncbi:hypothetical protein [Clostridium cochlearium]|uniref:hypothetical protein n=1 Tax=Clostridium cochlearium TaxID=1494 RepID=UPI001FA8F7BE|nr:hypothetical protein [Clostridium cochlearium]